MFKLEEFAGRGFLTSSLLQDEGLVARFSPQRICRLKQAERQDLIDQIENNKKLVCSELKIPTENLVIHSKHTATMSGL